MDGSAASFVYLLRSAGLYDQGAPRAVLRVTRPIEIRDGERRIRIEPGARLPGQLRDRFRSSVRSAARRSTIC